MKQCPRCGSKRFCVTAHVTQDWMVDENGSFLRSNNDCVEVTHFPDDEDMWDCADCGYSAAGKEFSKEVSPVEGEDVFNEIYEYIELFDAPGLFTNGRIKRETVPDGWYCYDLRGSDDDPNVPIAVEDLVGINNAGTVLLPTAVELRETDGFGKKYRLIHEDLNFVGAQGTLEEFCAEYGLTFPQRNPTHELQPITTANNQPPDKEAEQDGFVKVELVLHRYKMEALEHALRSSGASVEEHLQEYLINLYSESVPFSVQRNIRDKIDADYQQKQGGALMIKRDRVQRLREQYPPGTRVRLNCMPDDPRPIPPGTEGEVIVCDDAGQLMMRWDNGRSLSLIPGVDDFSVISRPEKAERQRESKLKDAPKKRKEPSR